MNSLLEVIAPERLMAGLTSTLSLDEVVDLVAEWPEGVTAVTQEPDGELLYWDAPLDEVRQARHRAGAGSMLHALGIEFQIHSAYLNLNNPVLAHDWQVCVVVPPIAEQ
ncbi:hypothetical protein [Pseudomonas monteilii]|uniref:hypothetical protein n=1 Tax=Pseudomonas monteilii TaxID=76759 RepID=UPI0015FB514C|nr:hypothetical protein [Pseudomonas monteilii]MBA6105256.1 hypothetical protein [Pseudomonas monteilii]